jgi:2-dehydro-3-deoxyphosphooctonate aldolase (KDO 8-P synthase)
VHGFFAETHPNPEKALSDGPNSIKLDELEEIVRRSQQIAELAHG